MALEIYRNLRLLNDWKNFKRTVKTFKYEFFNSKIQEILNKRKGLWELINWIKKRKLLAIEAIKYNSNLCLKIEDLWQALHKTFNLAQYWQVDMTIIDKILDKPHSEWPSFSKQEFLSVILKCSNDLTSELDKLLW